MSRKMKTNRGAAKRFRKTASGKVKMNRTKRRHILTKKSTKWKRRARRAAFINAVEAHLVLRLIPYK